MNLSKRSKRCILIIPRNFFQHLLTPWRAPLEIGSMRDRMCAPNVFVHEFLACIFRFLPLFWNAKSSESEKKRLCHPQSDFCGHMRYFFSARSHCQSKLWFDCFCVQIEMYGVCPLMFFNKLWLWGFDNVRLFSVFFFFFWRWMVGGCNFMIFWCISHFLAASFVKISLHINFDWVHISFDRNTYWAVWALRVAHEYSLKDTINVVDCLENSKMKIQLAKIKKNKMSNNDANWRHKRIGVREKSKSSDGDARIRSINRGCLLWWNDMRLTAIIQMEEY